MKWSQPGTTFSDWFFDQLGLACFVQGTGTPRSTMLEKFKDDVDSVLFGTDSNTFPAGWRHDRHAEQRAIVESLAPAALGPVFGENALRLLR